jgi:DNA primase
LPAAVTTRASDLARGALDPETLLEAVVLCGLATHPALIDEFAEAVESVDWTPGDHAELSGALLRLPPGTCDAATVRTYVDSRRVDRLAARPQITLLPVARPQAEPEEVRRCIRDSLARLLALRGAVREMREALEDFAEGGDESLTWRLAQVTRGRDAAARVSEGLRGEAEEQVSFADHYDDLLATSVAGRRGKK